jgi:hypothetical protein
VVGSVAGPVTEAPAKALPDLPVPNETPDVPKATAPVPSVPKPSPSASAAAETAGRVVGGGVEEALARVPSETEGPGALPGSRSEPGGRAVARRPDRRPTGPVEMAPLRRWRTHVWPAIALRVGDALKPLLVPLGGLADVHLPDVFGLPSPSAVSSSIGIDPPSERPGPPSRDLQSPSEVALPEGGMGFLAALLIGLLMAVGLVALARLVVGEDLFETRHWPGHRG